MTVTAMIRADARQRLFDQIRQSLTGVQVTYSEPAKFERRCVWLGETSGTFSPGQMKAARKNRTDEFTIAIHCLAYAGGKGTGDAYEMDTLVSALFAEVDSIVAESSVLAVNGSGLPGLNYCYLTEVSGPNAGPIVISEQVAGFGSEIIARLYCHCRLT